MSATLLVVLASAAPLARGISLRPRLGLFPVVFLALCLLWVGLLRYALPGFGRRLTWGLVALSGLTVLSLLPRFLWRGGDPALLHQFYLWVVLPATVVQVAMMAGLVSAPLWVVGGRLAKRWLRRLPASERSLPAGSQSPRPLAGEGQGEGAQDGTSLPRELGPGEGALGVRPSPSLSRERERGRAAFWPPRQLLRTATAQAAATLQPLLSRRALLTAAPWVLPGGALIVSAYGTLIESRRIVVRRVRIAVPGLPPALHGVRIGQVTDIHIANLQTQMNHLERALDLLAAEHPDIVCPTGDLCDEPRLHRDVLRLIKQVPARLGHYACLGNHELYLGPLDVTRRAYEHAQIQLLEDESVALGALRLCGVGYPHGNSSPRMNTEVVPAMLDAALHDRKEGETTVLLSHHPHVFQQVGGRGVALQLSGHTHGGQLGLGDGSWIEPIYPLARGRYRTPDGATQLFVSAGLGHWLPFRVNCPPEVAVIELVPA